MADDLTPAISSGATQPNQAQGDGQMVVQNQLSDMIEADRYLKAAAAAQNKRRGVRFSKILPAGAMSDCQGQRTGGSFDSPGGG
jgi:hypothetical protein